MEVLSNKEESLKKYKEYISTHIACVQKAFQQYGKDICEIICLKRGDQGLTMDQMLSQVQSLVEIHDNSKYDKEEFEAYAAKFYPWNANYNMPYLINSNFQKAWIHHYNNNKHHPEYWKVNSKNNEFNSNEMPNIYFAEMICDWIGVSMALKSSVIDWWNSRGKNQKRNILNQVDMGLCDEILNKHQKEFDFTYLK